MVTDNYSLVYKSAFGNLEDQLKDESHCVPLESVDPKKAIEEAQVKWSEILDTFFERDSCDPRRCPREPVISLSGIAFAALY